MAGSTKEFLFHQNRYARAAFEVGLHSSENDQIPMNDATSKEITKVKITKVNTSETEEDSFVRYYLLDCSNVWLDKYRY